MKSFVSIFGLCVLFASLFATNAMGQIPAGSNVVGGSGSIGGTSLAADVPSVFPGRFWFELNAVDNGMGYDGSFATFGHKRRLFQDALDGRWLGEAQGSVSLQSGGFIGNFGIERVFTVESAPADVHFGVFYDRDDSGVAAFSHTLDQIGVSAGIKTKKWDVRTNGYFPIGTSEYFRGDPTGADCFLGHRIVLQPGIDAGLQGFDTEVRLRPYWLTMVNGTLDVGGYFYDSKTVDGFGGARVRLGMQGYLGTNWSLEVNHDDRFETTAVAQVGWQFGANGGQGHEYSPIGRDLDKTVRSIHVTRFNQDLILAINPATGRPYAVHHVDNTATGGDGTFERRFDTLAKAEAASRRNGIIFVYEGDGTTTGMDEGIVLKDGQYLLGDGARHVIPIQDGRTFTLCNDVDGLLPTITNDVGAEVITMADDNVIRGFNIEGNAGLSNAIRASGSDNGTIDTVNIAGGTSFDGILLDAVTGDWTLADTTVRDAGRDGLHIEGVTDTSFRLFAEQGSYSFNGRDGINITDFDGRLFRFTGVRTDQNTRHGVFMTDHFNADVDTDYQFLQPIVMGNGGDGIFLQNLDGNVLFQNSNIQDNAGNGIHLVEVTNSNGGDVVTIESANGDTSDIIGNGIGSGAGVNVLLTSGTQRLRIRGSRIIDNGFGVIVRAENLGTVMETELTENIAISDNAADGGRFVSVGGAAHTVLIENTVSALAMLNNGTATGNGLSFYSGDTSLDTSSLDVVVRNVNLIGSGSTPTDSGIFGNVDQNGQLTVLVEDSTVNGSSGDGMRFVFDSNNGVLNTVTSTNNVLNANGDQGMDFDVSGTSLVDIVVSPSTITGSGAEGIDIAGSDTSLTRLILEGSTISGSGASGLNVNLVDTAQGIVDMSSTTITGNGGDGLTFLADGGSILSTRLSNNELTGNTGQDANLDTLGTGVINALVIGNTFGTFDAENGPTGRICMALSTNAFAGGALLTNNAAPADYVVELDGTSNGIGEPTFAPAEANFTRPPFGSTCEPEIEANEFIFESFGFSPR